MYPVYPQYSPPATVVPPPRLWRNRRLWAYPQVAVSGIPAEYLPMLQSLKFNRGIPMSWLAAVCERTKWNPDYWVTNAALNRTTVRQFGIAGIWGEIPEIIPTGTSSDTCITKRGTSPTAGWFGYGVWYGGPSPCYCGSVIGWGAPDNFKSVDRNLDLATTLLLNCADVVRSICGELNSLMFLRWQWGCRYVPELNGNGKCVPPPNIPDIFIDEMDTLVEIQRIYAEQLGEEPIVPRPTPSPAPGEGGSVVPLLGLLGLVGLVGILGLAKKQQQKRGIAPR